MVLTEVKAAGKSWQEMSQSDQEMVIDRVDKQTDALVSKCIRTLTSHEFPVVDGVLESP